MLASSDKCEGRQLRTVDPDGPNPWSKEQIKIVFNLVLWNSQGQVGRPAEDATCSPSNKLRTSRGLKDIVGDR